MHGKGLSRMDEQFISIPTLPLSKGAKFLMGRQFGEPYRCVLRCVKDQASDGGNRPMQLSRSSGLETRVGDDALTGHMQETVTPLNFGLRMASAVAPSPSVC